MDNEKSQKTACSQTKKSLGQHWLRSEAALELIIKTAALTPGERVLEVGPGRGVLTRRLLAAGARVVAVEKDKTLIPTLAATFAPELKNGQLTLLAGDILTIKNRQLKIPGPFKLVANLPFYITGKFLERVLASGNQPESMVLLLQKEVAERIAGRRGGKTTKESILSLSVKVFGEPRYVKTVPAGAFSPPPKVDSAILLIDKISRRRLAGVDEHHFFDLIHRGFSRKRKMLKNNLELKPAVLARCRIPKTARAEDLTLEQWFCLTEILSSYPKARRFPPEGSSRSSARARHTEDR